MRLDSLWLATKNAVMATNFAYIRLLVKFLWRAGRTPPQKINIRQLIIGFNRNRDRASNANITFRKRTKRQ